MLTPGGHRRFAIVDIDNFSSSRSRRQALVPVEEVWAEKAMRRTRRALAQPAPEAWFSEMTEEHRARHRQLGRQLMGLTLQYVSSEEENGHLLEQAREVGHKYGRISQEVGLPLTNALHAAIYFRDELIEVALQLPGSTQIRPQDNLRLMRRINQLLNVVHLAIAEIYEEEKS
jgi:hypothetical protein